MSRKTILGIIIFITTTVLGLFYLDFNQSEAAKYISRCSKTERIMNNKSDRVAHLICERRYKELNR